MKLKQISILGFRNIHQACLSFGDHAIIYLIGQNGQGKTNLLESIYVLLTGHSFRSSQIEHLKQKNNPYLSIKGVVSNKQINHSLEFQMNTFKLMKLNGKKSYPNALNKMFPVVILSPESIFVIKEGPDVRRKFLDQVMLFLNPQNFDILLKFTKVLKTKNKILKNIKEEIISYKEGIRLLDSLEASFLEVSFLLTKMRFQTIKTLIPLVKSTLNNILQTDHTDIYIEYIMNGRVLKESDNIKDILSQRMKELRDIEIKVASCLVGPHRHDINFIYNGQNARFYCSQGQQKALALAFKISQVLYYHSCKGSWPLFLLDDVFSELDKEKSMYLLDFLKSHKMQTFITSTELLKEFYDLDIQLYSVKNGCFTLENP